MQVKNIPRRRRPLSLTSLIDVVFLLLLFFMLTTTFSRFGKILVDSGQSGSGASQTQPHIIIKPDSDGNWLINASLFKPADQAMELERLKISGAKSAVFIFNDDANAEMLIRAIEKFHSISDITLTVTAN